MKKYTVSLKKSVLKRWLFYCTLIDGLCRFQRVKYFNKITDRSISIE